MTSSRKRSSWWVRTSESRPGEDRPLAVGHGGDVLGCERRPVRARRRGPGVEVVERVQGPGELAKTFERPPHVHRDAAADASGRGPDAPEESERRENCRGDAAVVQDARHHRGLRREGPRRWRRTCERCDVSMGAPPCDREAGIFRLFAMENHNCGFAETHVVESGKIASGRIHRAEPASCTPTRSRDSDDRSFARRVWKAETNPPRSTPRRHQSHSPWRSSFRGGRPPSVPRRQLGASRSRPRPAPHARCPPRSPRPPPPSLSRPARAASRDSASSHPAPSSSASRRRGGGRPRLRLGRVRGEGGEGEHGRRGDGARRLFPRRGLLFPPSRAPRPPTGFRSFLPRFLPAFLLTARPRRLSSPLSPPPRPRLISRR